MSIITRAGLIAAVTQFASAALIALFFFIFGPSTSTASSAGCDAWCGIGSGIGDGARLLLLIVTFSAVLGLAAGITVIRKNMKVAELRLAVTSIIFLFVYAFLLLALAIAFFPLAITAYFLAFVLTFYLSLNRPRKSTAR